MCYFVLSIKGFLFLHLSMFFVGFGTSFVNYSLVVERKWLLERILSSDSLFFWFEAGVLKAFIFR